MCKVVDCAPVVNAWPRASSKILRSALGYPGHLSPPQGRREKVAEKPRQTVHRHLPPMLAHWWELVGYFLGRVAARSPFPRSRAWPPSCGQNSKTCAATWIVMAASPTPRWKMAQAARSCCGWRPRAALAALTSEVVPCPYIVVGCVLRGFDLARGTRGDVMVEGPPPSGSCLPGQGAAPRLVGRGGAGGVVPPAAHHGFDSRCE